MNNQQIIDVLRNALKEGRLTDSIGFDDDIEIALMQAIKIVNVNLEQYNWHDLRKNPNDLPPDCKEVLVTCADEDMSKYWFGFYSEEYKFWRDSVDFGKIKVVAWKYIEEFKDE